MPERVNRLIGLCKLWGAVKVFHPYLAYRQDIDWDAALVAAIPKVRAAKDASEVASAVQEMLAALGDPVTRVIQPEPPAIPPAEHELQPTVTLRPDGILVVTVHETHDLVDWFAASQKLAAIRSEITKASGILFDFRLSPSARASLPHERGNLSMAFQVSGIASAITTQPVAMAGMRSRMHMGLASQFGPTLYSSAFRVIDGRWIHPAPDARDLPVVFLINGASELPLEAHALQIAGKALILSEGPASEACLLVATQRMYLSDEVTAEIRLGEFLCQDGSGGLIPDQVIPPSIHSGEEDAAIAAALELLKDFHPGKGTRPLLPVHTAPKLENSYEEMAYPPLEYRLLAAFRIWTAIHYFFPYYDLMGEDWDGVLAEFIPRMEQADSAPNYHLAVAEMMTHIHDSHSFIHSPVLLEHWGAAYPPVRLQLIEDTPLVIQVFDEEIAKMAGVSVGDVVLQIDGQNAMERIAGRARYKPASTPQSLMYHAAWMSLSGPESTEVILTVCDRDGQIKEVRLPRNAQGGAIFEVKQRTGEVTRFLTEEIGYADLDRLENNVVEAMFEKFKNTRAIVFDMRGYPNGTIWSIAPRLTEKCGVKAAMAQLPCIMAPDDSADSIERHSINYSIEQVIPHTDQWRYKGKTVMLIDERAISQAEHTGLFFKAANGAQFIGSHTAGANGDVTNFNVPGGIFITFTGAAIRYADGRQLQRIGLAPDLEIKPTIKGIQAGIDEVLEGAVQYLQRDWERRSPGAPSNR